MKPSTKGVGYSAVLTMVLIAFMTVYAELSKGFKDALGAFAGHHWVAKGIISLVFFAILALALGFLQDKGDERRTSLMVAAAAILMGAVIFGFFAFEFFSAK